MTTKRTCSHPGCELEHHAGGYCILHYSRAKGGRDMDKQLPTYKPYVPRRRKFVVTPEIIERIRNLALSHADPETAEILGCDVRTVCKTRNANGIPAFDYRRRPKRSVEIPAWVPDKLKNGFLGVARISDEFAAAKWARNKIKASRVRESAP